MARIIREHIYLFPFLLPVYQGQGGGGKVGCTSRPRSIDCSIIYETHRVGNVRHFDFRPRRRGGGRGREERTCANRRLPIRQACFVLSSHRDPLINVERERLRYVIDNVTDAKYSHLQLSPSSLEW